MISWSRAYRNDIANNVEHRYSKEFIRESTYRPFNNENLYFDRNVLNDVGPIFNMFPTPGTTNLVLCLSCVSSTKGLSALITDALPDLHYIGDSQCFPLYWYEEKKDEANIGLFDALNEANGPEYVRHDGITDYILKAARDKYKTNSITKEDIFYYVYGILHSEDYRIQFAADLKKMLPRLPLVDSTADFKAFSIAGRKLADLHLNYENRPAPKGVIVEGDNRSNYHVTKMRFPSKDNTSEIIYNSQITVRNNMQPWNGS